MTAADAELHGTGEPILHAGAALDQARGAVVMVHGRGAGPNDIIGLAPLVGPESLAYLAPSARNRTWYPYSFLTEIRQNEPWLSSALQVIEQLVSRLVAQGLPTNRIALLGFSQGACLASEFANRHPARYGGLFVFSGGLIGPPGTVWNTAGSFDGTPVFLGCSDVDPHIPRARVDESAALFERMGAAVTKRIYPGMGHLVSEDEVTFARSVLSSMTDD